jgi:hypothetical protein
VYESAEAIASVDRTPGISAKNATSARRIGASGISSSFDPDDRQQSLINSNRRRTTKYASDHNTRDLHQTGKPTLPGHCLIDLPDRVFEPHGIM